MHHLIAAPRWPLHLFTAILLIFPILAGCGATETPAGFQAGGRENPLDGAVLEDDGVRITLNLTPDGSALSSAVFSDGRSLGFDPAATRALNAVFPQQIMVGDESVTFDRSAGVADIQVQVPLLGPYQISVPINLGAVLGRSPFQLGGNAQCEEIASSIDNFCGIYEPNSPFALEQAIELATELAREQLGSEMADGFVRDKITRFFGVLDDFCEAWTELTEGIPGQTPPVDPCSL